MITNYNNVGCDDVSWLQNDVGDWNGSPPTIPKSKFKSWLVNVVMLFALLSAIGLNAQVTIPAGNTNTAGARQPLGSWFGYERSSMIYTPAEIGQSGNITAVGFYVNSVTTPGNAVNVRIYMKHKATATNTAATYNNEISGATLVYGPVTIPAASFVANQWITINLSTPFAYNGTSNLQILTETNATGGGNEGSAGKVFRSGPTVTNAMMTWSQDTTDPSASLNGTVTSNRPNIQLTIASSTPCSGTPVAGTTTPAAVNVCPGATPGVFSVTGATHDANIVYQWEESDDNGVGDAWTNAVGGTGAATSNYTPPALIGTIIYYRLRMTCPASSLSSTSVPAVVNATPTTQASAATTSAASNFGMTASWTNGNGARRVVYLSDSPTFTDPVNGSGPALTANTVYSGSGQQIVYDGTGTSVAVTGLAIGTTYYFKVYEYLRCNAAAPFNYYYNVTTGTNVVSAATCGASTIPYNESFETAVVPGFASCTATSSHPLTRSTTTTGAAPRTGTKYQNIRWTPTVAKYLYSNAVALTSGTSYDFGAWYLTDGLGGWTSIKVMVNTTPSATGATTLTTVNSATNTTYAKIQGTYVPSASGNYFMVIEVIHTSGPNDMSIDDLFVIPTPTCFEPTALTISNLTAATADLSWTAPASPNIGYEWAVTTSATPPASGTFEAGTSASVSGLTGNTTYYLHVRTECIDDTSFSIWNSKSFKFILGDVCASAIDLATLTSPYNGDTTGAADNFTNTCAGGNTSPDLVYYIDVPNGGSLQIGQTTNNYDSENTMFYGGACPGQTQIACYDDPDDTTNNWTNTTGSTQRVYWVQDGFSGATNFGTFTLAWTLTPPPSCIPPVALTISNLTAATADLSWGASTTPNIGYEWAVTTSATPPASGAFIAGTSTSVSGLTGGTTYYLHVRTECIDDTDFSTWATQSFRYLVGDTCALAIDLATQTSPINGTTVGSADNYDPSCNTSIATVGPDMFYKVDVPVGFTLVIGLTASSYDSVHSVHYGTCATNTSIVCTDTEIVNHTWVNDTGSTQTVYWVQDAWSSGTGTYTLAWTLTAPPITITDFTPTESCSADLENVDVVITGSNFTDATDVQLNGVSMPFDVDSDTQITVHLTASATSGTFEVINAVTSEVSDDSFTVNANPPIAPITAPGGATNICLPNTLDLDDAVPTGTWSSSNVDVATVDANGLVSSMGVGSVVISYTITNEASGCSSVETYALTISEEVVITSSTPTQSVVTGGDTSFSVTATGTGNPALTYFWEVCTDGSGVNFEPVVNGTNYAGADTATLQIIDAPIEFNFFFYQCTVTGVCNAAISDLAVLLVGETGIDDQPDNVTICDAGAGAAQFSITASPDVTDYLWYEDQGGDNWLPLSDVGMYSGTTTATLSLSGVTLANTGWRYKVQVTGIGFAESNPATLTVVESASIVTPPSAQSVCYTGGSAVFSVVTGGGVASHTWEYSSNGGSSWAPVAAGTPTGATYSGASTPNLTVNTTAATPAGNHQYRVIANATAPCANAESAGAALTITTPVVSVTPPAASYCTPGSPVSLTASGADTYTWSPSTGLSATTGASVTANPSTTTTYTVVGSTSSGCSSQTTVTVTVAPIPDASATATPATVCPGANSQLQAVTPIVDTSAAGYLFSASSGAYVPLVGGTNSTATGDDGTQLNIPIGFTFNYAGTAHNNFSVSTNGNIRLLATYLTNHWTNTLATYTNIIAPLWDDNNRSAGAISYATTGSVGSRVLTVQWSNVSIGGTGSSSNSTSNFQVQLFEGTNQIKFNYGALNTANGVTASIGISSATGKYLSVTPGSPASASTVSATTENTGISSATNLPSGTSYTFTPPTVYTYTYQWTPSDFIAGQETLANPVATGVTAATTYQVVITNNAGCSTTETVTVNVESGASITTPPAPQTVCQGQPASFTVAATGAGITYQWRRNGVNLTNVAPFSGVTTPTLSISAAAVANAGDYDVVVTPICGAAVTSTPVALVVNALPVITTQPAAPAAICATAGTAAVSVVATGVATYQWRRNGVNLSNSAPYSGVDTATLTLTNPAQADGGSFDVILTSSAGCPITSSAAAVTVNPAPATGTGVAICQGGSGSLTSITDCSNTTTTNVLTFPDIPATGAPTYMRSSGGTTYSASSTVSYTTMTFQVTQTGSYTLDGCAPNDSHMQLYSGTFNPASPATNFIEANDDSNPNSGTCGADPRIVRTLTAGVTYIMVYTPFSGTAGLTGITVTATPPAGGSLQTGTTGTIQWYTASSGGTAIGTGSPFNPVGVANSGLTDTNTPGVTTFYVACSNNPTCRSAVTFTINENVTYYADNDGDGYGNTAVTVVSCAGEAPAGYAALSGDCNDEVAAINPGAAEVPFNGVDDDCDGDIDETGTVTTTLLGSSCGVTLASINSLVGIQTVGGHPITGYRIRMTNGSEVQVIERDVPHFIIPQFPSHAYATTYSIDIQLQRAGIWQASWGTPCLVSTPAILAD
ncbi:MopE-related protein, partial [Flavobacterium caeni]